MGLGVEKLGKKLRKLGKHCFVTKQNQENLIFRYNYEA